MNNKVFKDVSEVTDPYWVDILLRLSIAYCKQALGRIRSKYTSSSAKFQLDGNTLLQEGTAEVQEVRQRLDANRNLFTVLN